VYKLNQIKVDGMKLEAFSVETGLKQGDALSPLLFNLALKKVVRAWQDEAKGISLDQYHIKY